MDVVQKRLSIVLILSIIFFSITSGVAYCDIKNVNQEETIEYLKEFGLYSGWANGNLKYQQGDYEMIPLYLQIGFDITSLFNKINIKPTGRVKFVLEPFLNTVISPSSNIEVGNNFILKYSHAITQKISMYFEFGLGLLYTTQHTYEQGTQFNFSQQGGAGFSYLFSENKAINLGYRFRHFSNADIKEPNGGIDMDYFLFGVTVFY